jgi:uncharacterized repeat protein (TIGR01451 family)
VLPPPPPPAASLTILKEVRNVSRSEISFVSQTEAFQGEQVEFRIRLTATGTVSNIVVNDQLPNGLIYVQDSLRVGGASAGNNLNSISVPPITNSSRTINFRANVGNISNLPVTLTNVATVTSTVGTSSAQASVVVRARHTLPPPPPPVLPPPPPPPVLPPPPPPPASATLFISKQVRNVTSNTAFSEVANARANERVEYRIEVKNTSTVNANNVKVMDTGLSPLTFISNTFKVDGNTVNEGNFFGSGYELGTLVPNQTKIILFEASTPSTVTNNSTVVNTATATAQNASTVNDQATVIIQAVAGTNIDLRLSKHAFNLTKNRDATSVTASPGDVIRYTLTVENRGNGVATGFVISDNINDILQLAELTSFEGGTLDFADNTIRWPAIDIAGNGRVEKTFTVRIRSVFPANTDFVMTNVYGNTVNVSVKKFVAPPTGSTGMTSFAFAMVVATAAFVVRKTKPAFLQRFVSFGRS